MAVKSGTTVPSLLAEIEESSPRKGPTCSLGQARDQLAPVDVEQLDVALGRALRGDGITFTAIARVLSGRGHHMKAGTVARHAKGECNCGTR